MSTYFTVRRGYADWLYGDTNNRSRIQFACNVEPNDPDCALARAEITENQSDELGAWDQAVRLNPRSAEVLCQAAIIREMDGDVQGAERLLLKAEDFNHLWLPRWSLASFYYRRGRTSDTLKWARLALRRAYGDRRGTFQLCRQAGASDQTILKDLIAPDDARNLSAFLSWIAEGDRLDVLDQAAAAYLNSAAHAKRTAPDPTNPAEVLSGTAEMLLNRGHPEVAHELWNRLLAQRLLTVAAATDGNALTNPLFAAPAATSPCFDWRVQPYGGVEPTRGVPPGGIRFKFDGTQPDVVELLVQAVDLAASRGWRLEYEYSTRNLSPDRYAFQWALAPWGAPTPLGAETTVAPSGGDGWTHGQVSWNLSGAVPDDARFFRLGFTVRRLFGHIPIEGEIQLRNVRLSPQPANQSEAP